MYTIWASPITSIIFSELYSVLSYTFKSPYFASCLFSLFLFSSHAWLKGRKMLIWKNVRGCGFIASLHDSLVDSKVKCFYALIMNLNWCKHCTVRNFQIALCLYQKLQTKENGKRRPFLPLCCTFLPWCPRSYVIWLRDWEDMTSNRRSRSRLLTAHWVGPAHPVISSYFPVLSWGESSLALTVEGLIHREGRTWGLLVLKR